MSAETDAKRLRDELVRLRAQVARESGVIASKRKAAANARAQALRSKSESTIRSRTREADRQEVAALASEKKRADLEKKVAEREKRLALVLTRWEKEKAASQKKALERLSVETRQAAEAFNRGPSLSTRPGALRDQAAEKSFDIFLSHASEDKDEIARPLAEALSKRGIDVWFDELNIGVGQSIRREIERGIVNARFGLVVISEHFMSKQWTQTELDALWGKRIAASDDSILPVWHKVTYDEVQKSLPLLAGLKAVNTSTMSIDEIAELLARAVKP